MASRNAFRLLLGIGCGFLHAAILASGNIAYAQPGEAAGSEVSAALVSEIVVTAERRRTRLVETPASISRLGAEEIARVGADHPSELLARAPGVLIHRGSGQEHLTSIRSPILTGGAGAGSFLFLQNGVPLRSAGFANVNGLFEAQTEVAGAVEVVRGPSGAFYGANAIHGVINVISAEIAQTPTGYVQVSGDTIERFKGAGFGSTTIGDHGFAVGFSILDDPGFRATSGVDQQKVSLQHSFDSGSIRIRSFLDFANLNQETAGFVTGDDAFLDPVLRRSNPNPEAFRDAKSVRLSSNIEVDLNEATTISVTPYARWTDMDFLLHFLPSKALEQNGHWSVGAQSAVYSQVTERISLSAGVDGEYTEGFLSEFQEIETVFSFTQGLHYDYDVSAINVSPFVQARFAITDRLDVVTAIRLDWTSYDYRNNTDDGVVRRFLRPGDRMDQFTTVSPKLSALYDVGGGAAFISYARGARPPQTTDLYRLQINQTIDPASPETIDSIEGGWRGDLTSRISFEAVGYFMDKRNFFFRDADGFNVNNGRTRHIGVEANAIAALTESVQLVLNAAYSRQTYRFNREIDSTQNAFEAIAFGDDVDSAPRWLAGGRALWTPDRLPIVGEAEWVYVGPYFLDASNTRQYDGHNLLHLRINWTPVERVTLFASLRNVLDKFYAERADFAFGTERYFPGEERTLTVGLRLNN
ncbi:MAG: TonB-dependent receptor [Pseudomonadota bacterium]